MAGYPWYDYSMVTQVLQDLDRGDSGAAKTALETFCLFNCAYVLMRWRLKLFTNVWTSKQMHLLHTRPLQELRQMICRIDNYTSLHTSIVACQAYLDCQAIWSRQEVTSCVQWLRTQLPCHHLVGFVKSAAKILPSICYCILVVFCTWWHQEKLIPCLDILPNQAVASYLTSNAPFRIQIILLYLDDSPALQI